MIEFLFKGLIRDSSRSRLPLIVVTIGVALTILLHAYITGLMGETIEMNARFSYGHLKVMTKAYAENITQIPNDLALTNVNELIDSLNRDFPGIEWSPRIHFGGLIDVPDEKGETRSQGPAAGMGIDLLTPGSSEIKRLNLVKSLIRGKLPASRGEALLGEAFSAKLRVNPGNRVTLISSTMYGSMSFYNFIVSGTVSFGQEALDGSTIIADIEDVRYALNMENAAGEIVGFLKEDLYDNELAFRATEKFKSIQTDDSGDFTPVMKSLSQQGNMGFYVNMSKVWSAYISLVFVIAMSLVLWNAGLLGGLRRYGEIGVRLAMGEEKGHVFRTMVYESAMIGTAGSILGTLTGLFFAGLIQKYGIDISGLMKDASILFPAVIKAKITAVDYYVGFIPGLFSTVIGTLLSGAGIYKRQTATLFKELEA